MTSEVTLYHWEPNANSGKPMLTLAEKGVEYYSVYIDMLNFDQHKPEYLAVNPQGTIPAMKHGDKVLTESTAIMEYVDEAFDGPRLMPDDSSGTLASRIAVEKHPGWPTCGVDTFFRCSGTAHVNCEMRFCAPCGCL